MKLFSGPILSQFAESQPTDAPAAARRQAANSARSAELQASALADPRAPTAARMLAISRIAQGGRWRVEAMRSLSESLLLWFTRGQGRITIAGVTRGYTAHNAVFIPAGTMFGFETSPQVFGTALYFGRGTDTALPENPVHLRIREAALQTELSGLLDAIQREINGAKRGHERAVANYIGLLAVWLERQIGHSAVDEVRPDAARRLVMRFTQMLEQDFRLGLGVSDYASALGVTPTHLSRVCNQTCGRPASTLLHDRTLFEARRLLAETRLPVNKISASLGFTSPAYFTRAFQARTGLTPTRFRREA